MNNEFIPRYKTLESVNVAIVDVHSCRLRGCAGDPVIAKPLTHMACRQTL